MPIDYTKRPAAPQPAAGGGPVSLTKLSLTKDRPSVSLTKGAGAAGRMRVTLTWEAGGGGGGLFRKVKPIDLDLACLWELTDGRKGVVQALGNAFGSLTSPPYVELDGDDRSGTGAGETITVNLDHLGELRRVLVFAYIYAGTPAWDRANAVVTLHPVGAAPIEVLLDEHSGARMVALALLEGGSQLTVRREVRYVEGSQRQLDEAYGWGLDWTPGRK